MFCVQDWYAIPRCFGVFASGEFLVDFLRRGSLNSLVQLPFTSAVKGKY